MRPSDHSSIFANVDRELRDLVPRYIANRCADIERAKLALERGDFEAIARIGHNMQGSGRSFGLDELSPIGLDLERAAQEGDRAGVLLHLCRAGTFLSCIDMAEVERYAVQLEAALGRAAGAPGDPATHGSEVLVVDDQDINVAIMSRFLHREGYKVRAVDSGDAALAALAVPPLPALVLLDVVMAGTDGMEVCRRIKSDPATGNIPVMLVSSGGSGIDRMRAWAAGADDFLTKPVRRDELIERVRSLLGTAAATLGGEAPDALEPLPDLPGLAPG